MEIAEFVNEISIYDEELDTNFIVHVTLPPDYDSEKTYPAYVLTDGVWRFGNHPKLRKEMENGKASDVLLVSIGYDYSISIALVLYGDIIPVVAGIPDLILLPNIFYHNNSSLL